MVKEILLLFMFLFNLIFLSFASLFYFSKSIFSYSCEIVLLIFEYFWRIVWKCSGNYVPLHKSL